MKTPKRISLALLALAVLVGCATGTGIYVRTDDFTGESTTELQILKVTGLMSSVYLKFRHPENGEPGAPEYALVTDYGGQSWMFVERIRFRVDGKIYDLDSIAHDRAVLAESVSEINVFEIEQELVEQIANAEEVRVRIDGSKRNLEFDVKEEERKMMRTFLERTQ